jgi:hypothetical protein
MKVKEFRESMRLIQSGDDPNRNQKLVETFKENRKRFRPVMRNLFIEKKKEPLSWFAMRLAYSRSLAVSNIVGYIVGIGDRHCSNILIDHSSGEMVHIDFGVAFGQVGASFARAHKSVVREADKIHTSHPAGTGFANSRTGAIPSHSRLGRCAWLFRYPGCIPTVLREHASRDAQYIRAHSGHFGSLQARSPT